MAYWRLCYHFVWTTKERRPYITSEVEPALYRWLYSEAKKLYCPFFYVGGIVDHVHVLTAVRPSIAPADFMKQLKGSSSRFISQEFHRPFEWQDGYGVFSISERSIDSVKAYVENQKVHHRDDSLIQVLEETDEWNSGPTPVEQPDDYARLG